MGNTVNPLKLRLGWITYWNFLWSNSRIRANFNLYATDILLYNYCVLFVQQFWYLDLLWYDTRIFRSSSHMYIFIYFFNIFVEDFFNRKYWWIKELSRLHVYKNNRILVKFFLYVKIVNFIIGSFRSMLQKNINCFFDTTARIKFAVISAEKYDSSLMAHYICIKLKQRYSFLRVINPFLTFFLRSLKRIHIVRGVKIQCSGRLSRKERASYIWRIKGKVPLTTIIAKISYTARIVFLHNSACCVKVWISYPLRFRHLKYFVLL